MRNALKHEGENDYTLKKDWPNVWITINGLSVSVRRMTKPKGVHLGVYLAGEELEEPISETVVRE